MGGRAYLEPPPHAGAAYQLAGYGSEWRFDAGDGHGGRGNADGEGRAGDRDVPGAAVADEPPAVHVAGIVRCDAIGGTGDYRDRVFAFGGGGAGGRWEE